MILKDNRVTLTGKDGTVEIERNSHGIPEIRAASYCDASFALGWVHANDRQMQMMLTKILLEGRAAEKISASDDLIAADRYIRSLNLYPDIAEQKKILDRDVRESAESYCAGVNSCIEDAGRCFEFKLLKCLPGPWLIEDTMMLAKAMTYFGSSDVQGNMKKLIVRMAQNGIDGNRLKELFPCLDQEPDVGLLRKVRLADAPPEGALKRLSAIPGFSGGSSWAVSGRLSESGMPVLCGGPHLDVNRMPSVWHEVIIRVPENTITGFSVPGLPYVITGRNRHFAYSPAYSFMDMTDFRIEECRDGKYRRGTVWRRFDLRREIIKTKKGEEIKADFYENEFGTLEGNPFEDGFYLIRSWSAGRDCGARDLDSFYNIMKAKTVREGMKHCREFDAASLNFVMADTGGNIGYQMSGRMYDRAVAVSGLLPLPAWDRRYNNRGYVSKNRLPSLYNPKEEFVIAAGQNLNHLGSSKPVNIPASPYRAERIERMIRSRKKSGAEFMKEIQYDLYSVQAERILKIILPLVTETKKGNILKSWDLMYKPDSEGASVFENIYSSMIETFFGEYGIGRETIKRLFTKTDLFKDYYMIFDNVILNKKSCWFKYGTREDLLRIIISEGLKKRIYRYGKTRKVYFRHLLLGDKIPYFSGLNSGPVELPGGRATVFQGQILENAGHKTAYSVSYRIIADMSDEFLLTNTTGGNCDRPFSKWYRNNNMDWLYGIYKKLS